MRLILVKYLLPILVAVLPQCSLADSSNIYAFAGSIPPPVGFTRLPAGNGSFPEWLRQVELKPDNTVHLYNGDRKLNQNAQFAVLDISVDKKNLQQCADAAIRLYAEYLYAQKRYEKISFKATDGTIMDYQSWREGYRFLLRNKRLLKTKTSQPSKTRKGFDMYLETVFSYAGTLSLSRDLKRVGDIREIKPGDIFVEGGSPGHAVIVMDLAGNPTGDKVFMLAQGYMPAQDIHILKNPGDGSAWYNLNFGSRLRTPEWEFDRNTLYRWE